jgi:hypothetical protein
MRERMENMDMTRARGATMDVHGRVTAICRALLLVVAAALSLSACGGGGYSGYQGSPYDHGCAFTRDCGPGG